MNIKEELRKIIINNTRVGGYPDTTRIAAESFALGIMHAEQQARQAKLERSIWCGASKHKETVNMIAWVKNAPVEDIEKMLTYDFSTTNKEDQQFLEYIWHGCFIAEDKVDTIHVTCDRESITYYWGEHERMVFKQTVRDVRPEILEQDPNQLSMI